MYVANLLALIGIVAQATVIVVMLRRRAYRLLPVFFFYIVWGVSGDSAIVFLRTVMHSRSLYPFEIQIYVDSFFQYLVLIELAWFTLRSIQRSLPKGFLLGISILIAAAAVLAWPLSGIRETLYYPHAFLVALHAQRAFAILRILFFLALACCSHFLSIGWRNRELQVATGLGFYSLMNLAGAIVHSHQSFGWGYFYVDVAVACSYLPCLAYWIYSFSQKEIATREMTPEMRHLLLGMANVLHQQRGRLSESGDSRA